jgi:hypothetical protein
MKVKRLAWLTVVLVGACSSGTNPLIYVNGAPSSTLSLDIGQELLIRMGTVGPGEYVSPPVITGTALTFLDVSLPDVQVPAGVTQVFRFKGVSRGQAVVVFHNTSSVHADVSDTVVVR